MDMEGCMTSMEYIPLTTQFILYERCFFFRHYFTYNEEVAERRVRWKTPLEGQELSLETCVLGMKRFPLNNSRGVGYHVRIHSTNMEDVWPSNQTPSKIETTRYSHVSIDINTADEKTAYSSKTHRIERHISEIWKYLRVQQQIY